MADAPEVKQGPATVGGQSDQPLKGEASATNAAMAQIPELPESPTAAPAPNIQQQAPETGQVVTGSDSDLLYGPTERPTEAVTHGAGAIHIPSNITPKLQALIQAAKDPDASPALKNLVQLALYHMNKR